MMELYILFWGYYDVLFNDFVYLCGGGFCVVQWWGIFWWQDNQFIIFIVWFVVWDEGYDVGFGYFCQYSGVGGGCCLVDCKQWGKDVGGWVVIVIWCVLYYFVFFQCLDYVFQIFMVNYIFIGV